MSDEMEDLQQTYPGAGTFQFGDTESLNQHLLKRVRNKLKTANCAPLDDFKDDPGAMPKAGRHDIAANWDGSPALIVKTISVKKVRFGDVTEEMAKAESKHKTLDAWRKAQESYLSRNGGFDPEMMLVFERFELVEDLADR